MPVAGNGEVLTPDACKRKLAIFDGRQRADIDLVFKRMDRVKADKGYQGPVVVCTVLYTPIAGHRPERPAIKYLIEQRDMEMWLAPIAGTRVLVPFRFSVPTPFGLGVLQATYFVAQAAADAGAAPDAGDREDAVAHPSSFAAYFCSSGYCSAAKMKVSGSTPNTLKLTQKSVVCVRQTISLSTASARKKIAQRRVSLRQPSSVRSNTESNTIAEQRLVEDEPAEQHAAEQQIDDRRLHLDEGVVLQHQRQRRRTPPRSTAVTIGITGRWRVSA